MEHSSKDGIYETHSSRNQRKKALREICHVNDVVTLDNKWSDMQIKFDREDQPMRVHSRGVAALIPGPIIDGYRLIKVLMDGGKSLNLMYEDTFQKM